MAEVLFEAPQGPSPFLKALDRVGEGLGQGFSQGIELKRAENRIEPFRQQALGGSHEALKQLAADPRAFTEMFATDEGFSQLMAMTQPQPQEFGFMNVDGNVVRTDPLSGSAETALTVDPRATPTEIERLQDAATRAREAGETRRAEELERRVASLAPEPPKILTSEEISTRFPGLPEGSIVQETAGDITVKFKPEQDSSVRTEKINSLAATLHERGVENPIERATAIIDGTAGVQVNQSTGEVLFIDEGQAVSGGQAVTALPVQIDIPEINPESSIEPSVDAGEATGLAGKLRRGVNILTDSVGGGLSYPQADEATSALNNLQVRTMSLMQSEVPGRPSNFLLQQLEKLTVEPNSVFQGSGSAKNRLEQTRAMIENELERIDTSVLPLTLNQTQRQQTMINRTQLAGLLADYNRILGSFNNPAAKLDKSINEMTLEELNNLDESKLNPSQLQEASQRYNQLNVE